jgi:hypothetical protein
MENNLVFVSAQPDVPYFHWQTKVYCHNFIEKGIDPKNIHVLFAMVNTVAPTEQSLELKKLGVNVHHYEDTRTEKIYIPSLRPMILSRWLKDHPELAKCYFYHDSDIVFREIPNFKKLMEDDIIYLSDTISYIGYNYIEECCGRYETRYPRSGKNQLLEEMANVIGVSVECIKSNQENSGGAQYLMKNIDHTFWDKVLKDCVNLYNTMLRYQSRFPISPGEIQMWTSDMWAVLWNVWYLNKETRVTDDLDFSWATDTITQYNKKPILHMAGVTEGVKKNKFYKGEFINVNPLDKLKDNINHFDYVDKNSATIKYVDIMKSIVKKES